MVVLIINVDFMIWMKDIKYFLYDNINKRKDVIICYWLSLRKNVKWVR